MDSNLYNLWAKTTFSAFKFGVLGIVSRRWEKPPRPIYVEVTVGTTVQDEFSQEGCMLKMWEGKIKTEKEGEMNILKIILQMGQYQNFWLGRPSWGRIHFGLGKVCTSKFHVNPNFKILQGGGTFTRWEDDQNHELSQHLFFLKFLVLGIMWWPQKRLKVTSYFCHLVIVINASPVLVCK